MNTVKGICVYHLIDSLPCTGGRCEECELSPAYEKGAKKAHKECGKMIRRLISNIAALSNQGAYREGYEAGAKETKAKMAAGEWHRCDKLPEDDKLVFVIVNGRPKNNICLHDAVELASYVKDEGWKLERWPDSGNFEVEFWADINTP